MTEAVAVQIYKCKLADQEIQLQTVYRRPCEVARLYRCSPKIVRDIWNHVTWKYATKHLWSTAPSIWQGRGIQAKVRSA
jgi:hypothetical protein